MESRTVSYKGYTVTVSEATALMGMKRQTLKGLASEQNKGEKDTDIRIMRILVYPDLVAATTSYEGFSSWPIPFEEFLTLPDRFTTMWEEAVFGLNPHWLPGFNEAEEKKKDGEPPTS